MRNEAPVPLPPYIEAYRNREVTFVYRSRSYNFSLSHGLFSSAGIDTGSRLLLKIFSNFLDRASPALPAGLSGGGLPFSVLDAGSGAGVLGICAAGALSAFVTPGSQAAGPPCIVRAQDRDELARLFTEYNARRNGLPEEILSAHTEPLLAGPAAQSWDLILANIPAKAGPGVLEDFVRRSAAVLKKDGRVFLVAVAPLAGFFRSRIEAAGAPLLAEESGKEHTVFVYGPAHNSNAANAPLAFDTNFPFSYPFYIRNKSEYTMEEIAYRLDTVHGAPDFDNPGGGVQAAAKLAVKINLASKLERRFANGQANGKDGEAALLVHDDSGEAALLVHDDAGEAALLIHDDAGQGHFAVWLFSYLADSCENHEHRGAIPVVLSGRNILALAAARAALVKANEAPDSANAAPSTARPGLVGSGSPAPTSPLPASPFPAPHPSIVPTADIFLNREQLAAALKTRNGFALIALFPETAPETNRGEAVWKALTQLAAPECIVIAGMSSAESERFDKKKSPAWRRLGDIKRKGFRALAYMKNR